MRTCPKCGCYIPDNWIPCPACEAREQEEVKTEWNPWKNSAQRVEEKLYEDNALTVYRVDVLYDYERVKTCEYFGTYENALKYARKKANKKNVLAVQIITGSGRIIYTVRP